MTSNHVGFLTTDLCGKSRAGVHVPSHLSSSTRKQSFLFEFLVKKNPQKIKNKKAKQKNNKKKHPPKNGKRTLYSVMLKTVLLVHKCTWYAFSETEFFRPNICNTKNTLYAVHICLHCNNNLWGKYSRPPESRADFVIRTYIVRWSELVWKVYPFLEFRQKYIE